MQVKPRNGPFFFSHSRFAPMEKLTNRVIVWLWADKRGLTFAADSHVNQERYTKNVESVSFSHSLLINIMRKNCAGQGGNCLRKRASDNFSSDSSHQSAEPYLTPSTWHTVDMLKNPVPNTSGSLSQSLTSKRTISDSFWTTNNNAMIAFFAVLGVFILALGLWVSFSRHCILVKLYLMSVVLLNSDWLLGAVLASPKAEWRYRRY